MSKNDEMFDIMVREVEDIYGSLLVRIILYGSVARGTQTPESDIDIAIILKEGHTKAMRNQLTDLMVDLELEYNKVISVIRIDDEKYREWGEVMPFYVNVKKEGIVLWPAA